MNDAICKLHYLVAGVNLTTSSASEKRVGNLLFYQKQEYEVVISNLIHLPRDANTLISVNQKFIDNSITLRLNYKNIISIIFFYLKGFFFIYKQKYSNKKNIYYNYGYPDITNILFICFAKIIGYKILFDLVEDDSYLSNYRNLQAKIKIKSSLILFSRIHLFADLCITISEHLFNKCQSVSKNKFPVYLIPISVDLSKYENKSEINVPKKSFIFFYGGSFGEKDGLEYLLKAFESVAYKNENVRLILTGQGSSADPNRFLELINKTSVSKQIEYLGFLTDEEYYSKLIEVDAFCVTRINSPYANAGFPFKLGEYLAAGKVVIVSRVGDVPKYLTSLINSIIVKPNDEKELTNAMLFCLQNKETIERIGQKGKDTVRKYFDSAMISEKFYNILLNI